METTKFKHLLEYFVTHLEWCQNEDTSILGYQKYIKKFVEKNKFRKAGQGYNRNKIQSQIKEWESYSIGKICINISAYTRNKYISEFCYLNWLGTGINICAKWENSKIKSLYLTEYRYWEGNTPRVNLGVEYSLSELKLFEEGITSELETFFDKYKNYFIQFKQMNNIQKTLNLLKYKKQIILQGPPGTGKTREAKELAKELLNIEEKENLKSNKRFQIIQFHPSYSYEDFVRGIVAKPNSNGDGITYEAENKVLTEFAENAEKDSNSNYVLIIDEINRANLSSVLGELIYALEYRGEAVDSMYAIDGSNESNRSNKITLPPNLYIIGTMNTADRSVGHIDYAIRRRFAFVDVLPRDLSKNNDIKFEKEKFTEVSKLFIKNFDLSKDYSKEKIEKSDYLSNEFDVKDVWLGHSYFIEQYEKDNNGEDIKDKPIDFRIRLEYEIKPILREYVKDGVLKELAINEINKL